MKGKHHAYVALFVGVILYAIIGLINLGKEFPNPFWPFLLGTLCGGGFPDIDITYGSIERHRNPITHSGLVQLGITISYMFTPDYTGFIFFLIFFNITAASHLAIDIIPGKCPEQYTNIGSRWGYRLGFILTGKSPGNIIRIPNKHEQKWLLLNALMLFICAFVLYLKLQYAIDLDLPIGW